MAVQLRQGPERVANVFDGHALRQAALVQEYVDPGAVVAQHGPIRQAGAPHTARPTVLDAAHVPALAPRQALRGEASLGGLDDARLVRRAHGDRLADVRMGEAVTWTTPDLRAHGSAFYTLAGITPVHPGTALYIRLRPERTGDGRLVPYNDDFVTLLA